MRLLIPAVRYVRPDGRRDEGAIEVDGGEFDAERLNRIYVNLGHLKDLKIEITLEMVVQNPDPAASIVSICLDDGDHDHRMEHVRNDGVQEMVLRMIEEFDLEKYAESRRERGLPPREPGPDDVAAMVAHDAAADPFADGDDEWEDQ